MTASSLVSPVAPEQSASRTSHYSARSTSESSSFDSDGALPGDVVTSTPKAESSSSPHPVHANYNGHISSSRPGGGFEYQQSAVTDSQNIAQKYQSGYDRRSSSQKVSPFVSTRLVAVNQQSSVSESPGSRMLASFKHSPPSHLPASPQQHTPSNPLQQAVSNYRSRGIETPVEPPPAVPATEHPGYVTPSSSTDNQSPTVHYAQPSTKLSSDASRSDHTWSKDSRSYSSSRGGDGDPGVACSTEYETRNTNGDLGKISQCFPSRSQSSMSQAEPGTSSSNLPMNINSSADAGHAARRLHVLSVQSQKPQLHARPASSVGQSPHIRGVYSRPPGEGRLRQQQRQTVSGVSPGHSQIEQNMNNSGSGGQYNRSHIPERPKSVPPKLFNRTDEFSGGTLKDVSAHLSHGVREERETASREIARQASDVQLMRGSQTFSNISLIREPSKGRLSSQFGSQLGELQDFRQSQQQQPSPHPQQENLLSRDQSSMSGNRHSGTVSAHASTIHQESSQSHAPVYHSTSWAGPRSHTMGQLSSSRPDSLPLTPHQEQRASRPEWRHMRQNHDPHLSLSSRGGPTAFPRSQSSTATPFSSMSSSDFSPGAQHPRSSTPSSSFSPGAQHARSSTPGIYPGRHTLSQDEHGTNSQVEESGHQLLPSSRSDGTSAGLSLNYRQDPSRADRELRQHQGVSEARNIPSSPQTESYSASQAQLFSPKGQFYSWTSNPPPPPPRSRSQGPPQNRMPGSGPSKSVCVTAEPTGYPSQIPQQQQQNTIQPQIRPHGTPSSSYPHNSASPQLHSPSQAAGPPQPSTSQVVPQSKTVSDSDAGSEREAAGQQTTSTNSVWYEYGCV